MELVNVYKGGSYNVRRVSNIPKAIVFDLDETLGDFANLYTLWQGIKEFLNIKNDNLQNIFNELLDLFPEFLRCGILIVLNYIKEKKTAKRLRNLFIYTNNKCFDSDWIKNIMNYFDYKLETTNLFDKAICAFKIDNKIINLNNKHEKNINYFINCTIIPKNTEICFIDNSYYKEMIDNKVYYIQPYSYNHNIKNKEVIERFMTSDIGNIIIKNSEVRTNYKCFLIDWFKITSIQNIRPRLVVTKHDCIEVTKKILYHIQEFFILYNKNSKTKKRIKSMKNFTRKRKLT